VKRFSTFTLFLLLICCQLFAQDGPGVFHLGNIPPEGIKLDKGWVYRPGDEAGDALLPETGPGWVTMDPNEELHHLPVVRKNQIGWFRLKLVLDSSMFNKTAAFIFSGLGASEIYLNGKQLFRFGEVSTDFNKEVTRYSTNQLLSIRFDSLAEQVLAIRHSFNNKNLYLKFSFPRPVAGIVLKDVGRAYYDQVRNNSFGATLRSIQVSFYLPLGFLLIFLFWSFRLQKEYLFSGIFCLSMFSAVLLHIFALTEPITVSRSNYLLYTTQVLYIVGALSFLHSIYVLFKKKKSYFFYFIGLYGLVSLVLYFINYDLSGLFNAAFFPLINLEFLRLSWQAFRSRRKGAGLLLITSLVLNLSLLLYVYFMITDQFVASAYLQSISFVIPGLGLSLFYAGEFGRTAGELHQRVIEIEKLSHEKIEQEKEKQQLLTAHNEMLEGEVSARTSELSRSLEHLKETQHTLVQREKMASLGELTAGIAHEIQNPLNFVNNFSEVNGELLAELKEELQKGDLNNASLIVNSIIENEKKINSHGKRADSIVKGMLKHGRSSSGNTEPTDINELVEEYTRLAYHGFRTKDKNFNVTLATHLDKTIGKLNLISQDMGRVLLNLVTNALYSVDLRRKEGITLYEPAVTITTRQVKNHVEVQVGDNGRGIPPGLVDKIFQPFFTTKPTGQGTGLGLSVSYDIVKAHGGDLRVENSEGEGTQFIVEIPA
jgi:two-component system, NtrC family, sensor kinase